MSHENLDETYMNCNCEQCTRLTAEFDAAELKKYRDALETVLMGMTCRSDLESGMVADRVVEWAQKRLGYSDGLFALPRHEMPSPSEFAQMAKEAGHDSLGLCCEDPETNAVFDKLEADQLRCKLNMFGHSGASNGEGCAGCDAEHIRVMDKFLGTPKKPQAEVCCTEAWCPNHGNLGDKFVQDEDDSPSVTFITLQTKPLEEITAADIPRGLTAYDVAKPAAPTAPKWTGPWDGPFGVPLPEGTKPYSPFDRVPFQKITEEDAIKLGMRPNRVPTFEEAWKLKEAAGYQYGHDALEQVRFGWDIRSHYALSDVGRTMPEPDWDSDRGRAVDAWNEGHAAVHQLLEDARMEGYENGYKTGEKLNLDRAISAEKKYLAYFGTQKPIATNDWLAVADEVSKTKWINTWELAKFLVLKSQDIKNVGAPEGKKSWNITLNEYQRANLLWLFELIGYPHGPGNGIEPFTYANTGDWVGEIPLMLGMDKDRDCPPNISKGDLVARIKKPENCGKPIPVVDPYVPGQDAAIVLREDFAPDVEAAKKTIAKTKTLLERHKAIRALDLSPNLTGALIDIVDEFHRPDADNLESNNVVKAAMYLHDSVENWEKLNGFVYPFAQDEVYGESSVEKRFELLRKALRAAGMTRC